MYQEPKKLAELQLGVRNFCGDFNARNKENKEDFSINLNTQHVNGMTHFDSAIHTGKLVKNACTVIRYSRVEVLLFY